MQTNLLNTFTLNNKAFRRLCMVISVLLFSFHFSQNNQAFFVEGDAFLSGLDAVSVVDKSETKVRKYRRLNTSLSTPIAKKLCASESVSAKLRTKRLVNALEVEKQNIQNKIKLLVKKQSFANASNSKLNSTKLDATQYLASYKVFAYLKVDFTKLLLFANQIISRKQNTLILDTHLYTCFTQNKSSLRIGSNVFSRPPPVV